MCINVKKSRARTKLGHLVEMDVARQVVHRVIVVLDQNFFLNRCCSLSALECERGRGLHCATNVRWGGVGWGGVGWVGVGR